MMHKKIVITGPESTGKSLLVKELAEHYNSFYVSEFARKYIDELEQDYQESDLLRIAHGQMLLEDEVASLALGYLFCDTELTVIDIWSQEKYGRTHDWIKEEMGKRAYDLYLLTDVDLEWTYDPQRENEYDRDRLLSLYKKSLESRNINYKLVSGQGDDRLANAIKYIDECFKKN